MVSEKFADACIMNGTCKQGITGTFWMKYDAGDFIFASTGGIAGEGKSLRIFFLVFNEETSLPSETDYKLCVLISELLYILTERSQIQKGLHCFFVFGVTILTN